MNSTVLDREEYVEQEYFFRIYRERLQQNVPSQEILQTIQEEILATTRLPMAIDFLRTEILHSGRISEAMVRLAHYFTPFQAFVIRQAEDDESRFEQITALRILEREAHYRSRNAVPAGLFIYQFECIARNRLGYNDGLLAMSQDPLYDSNWRQWILTLRMDLGARELADIVYRASQHFHSRRRSQPAAGPSKKSSTGRIEESAGNPTTSVDPGKSSTEITSGDVILFGDQEGRIARANIGRDPLYFFAALQRQLDYPAVPRSARADDQEKLPGFLEARLMKIEQRLKLIEMEQRGGIDLNSFYRHGEAGPVDRPAFSDDVPDLS
jgi:hypothetical protein